MCMCACFRKIKSGKGHVDGQVITLLFKILKHGIYDNHIVICLLKHKNMDA